MGGIRQKVETGVKGQCLLGVNHRGAEQKLLFFLLLLTPFLIYEMDRRKVTWVTNIMVNTRSD